MKSFYFKMGVVAMKVKKRIIGLCIIILLGIFGTACARTDSSDIDSEPSQAVAESNETATEFAESVSVSNTSDVSEISGPLISKSQLLEDFDQLVAIIENNHPKLYTDVSALESMIETTRLLIDKDMTELEFFRLLSPIVTKLDCGHTCLMLSPDTENRLMDSEIMFPLYIHWIGTQAYVTQNPIDSSVPIGAELLSINGKPMTEIRELLLTNISADGTNMTRKVHFMNNNFNYFYAANVEAVSIYEISYRQDEGSAPVTETVRGVKSTFFYDNTKSDWLDSDPPFESRFEDAYAVLTFHSFYPEGAYTLSDYQAFMDDFFAQVKAQDIQKIILDVRGNGGGDPYVASHLFSYLAKTEQPYFIDHGVRFYQRLFSAVPLAENRFTGKLAILMDGISFSTSGHLLALLKSQGVGTFFGEESGGSFACTDSSQDFSLKNTNLRFHSSMQVWEVLTEGLTPGRGILPDFPVEPTLAQYLSGDDVILDVAIEWIHGK